VNPRDLPAGALARERIDALVARFFRAFDNRNGAVPEVADVTGCFTARALIVRYAEGVADFYTPEEFALPRIELLTKGALLDFHEWETGAATEIFGGMATRTSRYSKSGLFDGKDYAGSGTKCFQLVEQEGVWRICALAWTDDAQEQGS